MRSGKVRYKSIWMTVRNQRLTLRPVPNQILLCATSVFSVSLWLRICKQNPPQSFPACLRQADNEMGLLKTSKNKAFFDDPLRRHREHRGCTEKSKLREHEGSVASPGPTLLKFLRCNQE